MYCKTQLSVSELSVTLSSNIEKRWLSQLPGYAECKRNGDARHSGTLFNTSIDVKNGEARHSGTLFNTATSDKVRRLKKGQLFHFT